MAGTHDIFLPIEDRDNKADRERDGCIDGFCALPTNHQTDEVNPSHYQKGGIECIDVMRAVASPDQFQAHLWLTAMKYLYRLHSKGTPSLNVRKAIWYLKELEKELSE